MNDHRATEGGHGVECSGGDLGFCDLSVDAPRLQGLSDVHLPPGALKHLQARQGSSICGERHLRLHRNHGDNDFAAVPVERRLCGWPRRGTPKWRPPQLTGFAYLATSVANTDAGHFLRFYPVHAVGLNDRFRKMQRMLCHGRIGRLSVLPVHPGSKRIQRMIDVIYWAGPVIESRSAVLNAPAGAKALEPLLAG